jgi:hypothetical protein
MTHVALSMALSLQDPCFMAFNAVHNAHELRSCGGHDVIRCTRRRYGFLQIADCLSIIFHGGPSKRPIKECARTSDSTCRFGINKRVVNCNCLLRSVCRGMVHRFPENAITSAACSEKARQSSQYAHSHGPIGFSYSIGHADERPQAVKPVEFQNGPLWTVKTREIVLSSPHAAPRGHVSYQPERVPVRQPSRPLPASGILPPFQRISGTVLSPSRWPILAQQGRRSLDNPQGPRRRPGRAARYSPTGVRGRDRI